MSVLVFRRRPTRSRRVVTCPRFRARTKLTASKLRVEPRLLLNVTKMRLLLCDISPFVQPRAQGRAVNSLDASDQPSTLFDRGRRTILNPSQSGGGHGVIASEPAKVPTDVHVLVHHLNSGPFVLSTKKFGQFELTRYCDFLLAAF